MILFYPFRYRFELNPDEGINAVKAMMVLKGYALYTDIWSDQPPLLTYLLAALFRLFGLKIAVGRAAVLLFAAVGLATTVWLLRKDHGAMAAGVGAVTLVLVPSFLVLSVSLMIGLPSIVLAYLSFAAIGMWHTSRRTGWLVVSGLIMAASILAKGFTLFLVPLWGMGLLALTVPGRATPSDWKAAVVPALVWGAAAVLPVAGVLVAAVRPANFDQLIQSHLLGGGLQETLALEPATHYLAREAPLLVLAFAGCTRLMRNNSYQLLLGVWLVGAIAALLVVRPVWSHTELLVTFPASTLAAIAGAAAVRNLAALARGKGLGRGSIGALVVVGCFGWFLVANLPRAAGEFRLNLPNFIDSSPVDRRQRQVAAVASNYASGTEWFFTDRPMVAFLTGIPVPPNLAAITQKRLESGALTDDEILASLEEYRPELILNTRFLLPVVDRYLREHDYEQVAARLYVLRRSP